ncbi:MAG TPA: nucleoside-diphosphate kinase [Bacteroidales bacterium]|nr:nucleoside-diphosphate kinase [Bacteroidales bacterium]
MARNITLTIIKPFAVQNGYTGGILGKINEAGFRIVAMKYLQMTPKQAGQFYAVHKAMPFYDSLVSFMSSGPVVAAILEKENAVEEYRKLIGSTDPSKAEKGTIRQLFGKSIQQNAVHGSDSDENAEREAAFFFSEIERY